MIKKSPKIDKNDLVLNALNSLKEGFSELGGKLDKLDKKVSSLDSKFSTLDKKVSSLDKKVDMLDKRVDRIETDVQELKGDTTKIWAKQLETDKKIGVILDKLTADIERSERQDTQFEEHEVRLNRIDLRLGILENN